MITPERMLLLLYLCLFAMVVIAIFYLRRRQLTNFQYLFWGLVALLFPLLGPYIVILARPGRSRFKQTNRGI